MLNNRSEDSDLGRKKVVGAGGMSLSRGRWKQKAPVHSHCCPVQALITSPWALVSLVTWAWSSSLFKEFPGAPGWSQYMLAELEVGGQPRAEARRHCRRGFWSLLCMGWEAVGGHRAGQSSV